MDYRAQVVFWLVATAGAAPHAAAAPTCNCRPADPTFHKPTCTAKSGQYPCFTAVKTANVKGACQTDPCFEIFGPTSSRAHGLRRVGMEWPPSKQFTWADGRACLTTPSRTAGRPHVYTVGDSKASMIVHGLQQAARGGRFTTSAWTVGYGCGFMGSDKNFPQVRAGVENAPRSDRCAALDSRRSRSSAV